MSISQHAAIDAEHNRLQQASELATDSGPGWADEYLAGTYGCHELLDRTALVADLVERHLLAHPACVANATWYLLAEQAAAALRELYQLVGAEDLEAGASINCHGAGDPS